jgi:hypothetical protein
VDDLFCCLFPFDSTSSQLPVLYYVLVTFPFTLENPTSCFFLYSYETTVSFLKFLWRIVFPPVVGIAYYVSFPAASCC